MKIASTASESLTGNDVFAKQEAIAWNRVGDEAVVLDIEGNKLRGMNLTAWTVWERLDGKRSLGEISSDLADLYGVDHRGVLEDVKTFVRELHAGHLVVQVT